MGHVSSTRQPSSTRVVRVRAIVHMAISCMLKRDQCYVVFLLPANPSEGAQFVEQVFNQCTGIAIVPDE